MYCFPRNPMASLCHRRSGTATGTKTRKHLPSQVSYRHPAIFEKHERSGTGASRHPPPQVARVIGLTQQWDEGGGSGSGSSSIRRFRFRGRQRGRDEGQTRTTVNVARVFRGEGHHKVDSKGRVSIPALFRRVLEASDPDWTEGLNPNLVIFYGPKTPAISGMLHDGGGRRCRCRRINQDAAGLEGAPPMLEKQCSTVSSFPTSVDETGRLVLPAKLRQQIGHRQAKPISLPPAIRSRSGTPRHLWSRSRSAKTRKPGLTISREGFDMFTLPAGRRDLVMAAAC